MDGGSVRPARARRIRMVALVAGVVAAGQGPSGAAAGGAGAAGSAVQYQWGRFTSDARTVVVSGDVQASPAGRYTELTAARTFRGRALAGTKVVDNFPVLGAIGFAVDQAFSQVVCR